MLSAVLTWVITWACHLKFYFESKTTFYFLNPNLFFAFVGEGRTSDADLPEAMETLKFYFFAQQISGSQPLVLCCMLGYLGSGS